MVYDISSRETYNALTNWLTDARTLASPDIVIVLVGNKKDLEPDREVTFLEASKFAQDHGERFCWAARGRGGACSVMVGGVRRVLSVSPRH